MDEFIESIDNYLSNYSTYKKGNVEFEFNNGELIFYKNKSNTLTLFGIYINPEFRRQGFCKNILNYLIDSAIKHRFKYLCVQSVLSKILYEYLLRFTYKNNTFKVDHKIGFVCDLKTIF